MKMSCLTNGWGNIWGLPGGVTSIKDNYYYSDGDIEHSLKVIKKSGYEGIELFAGNLMNLGSEELSNLLQKYDLKLVGVYIGANYIYDDIWEEEKSKIMKVVNESAVLKCENIILGGGAIRTNGKKNEDYNKLSNRLNELNIEVKKKYMKAHYHPHAGSLIETEDEIDKIIKQTTIDICVDTAHIELCGGDPLEVIKKHKNRISYCHLKDFKNNNFLPLGKGNQNLEAIINVIKNSKKYSDWITVEFDGYHSPDSAAEEGITFLKKYFK